ncbi:MAG: M28 family peptidase [Saprospiraceae bacterium]|nr:M28 family peptidase [Saprospiraceae bacterium]
MATLKIYFTPLLISLTAIFCQAQNAVPAIENFHIERQNNNLTITFDAMDPDNTALDISCKLFSADDATLHEEIQPQLITGDIGFPVASGLNKLIVVSLNQQQAHAQVRVLLKVSDREPLDLIDLLKQVSPSRLSESVYALQGIRNNRNPVFYDSVRQGLVERLGEHLPVRRLEIALPQQSCVNVEASQFGHDHPSEMVLIDAHYDSYQNAPGADDNASGVAGVLEACRILSRYSTKRSLRYVCFDLEEAGLIGSLLYEGSQVSPREQIHSVLNYEMIGYYTDEPNTQDLPAGFNILFPEAYNQVIANGRRGNFLTNVANVSSHTLRTIFDRNAADHVPDLKVISLEVTGNGIIAPDLRRSDHAVFWDNGIPALMLSDGANFRNKKYHTLNDSAQYLNYEFMANIVRATIATAAELAGLEHAGSKSQTISISSSAESGYDNDVKTWLSGNKLYLQSYKPLGGAKIILYDALGTQLASGSTSQDSEYRSFTMPQHLYPGLYWIHISSKHKNAVLKVFYNGQ